MFSSKIKTILIQFMGSRYIYIILLIFCSLCGFSQNYKFDHLTANEGLGDNFIRRLFEDSNGFIWVGTKDGLSRYDGYNVKTYKKDLKDTNSLPSSYIGGITEDHKGRLWIGTGKGLALYNREFENFTSHSLESKKRNSIYGLMPDSVFLWIATSNGLCRFNTETFEKKWFFSDKGDIQSETGDTKISRIIKGRNNSIWVGFANDNGLVRLNTENYATKHYRTEKKNSGFISQAVTCLFPLNDTILLVGYRDEGIFKLNTDKHSFEKVKIPSKTPVGLTMPWHIFKDSNNTIWIGSINGGLYKIKEDLTESENIIPSESSSDYFNSLSVSVIIEDRHKNIWFGTHGGGLNILSYRKSVFNHCKQSNYYNSVPHNYISCFHETSNGKILIGTDGGGMSIYNKSDKSFKTIGIKEALSSNAILSIQPYADSTVLIATWDGGINIFNHNSFENTVISHHPDSLNSINYKNLKYALKQGDSIYIFTHGMGVNIYNTQKEQFYHSSLHDSLSFLKKPESCNKALFDSTGTLWIASHYGLFSLQGNHMEEFMPDTANPNSINGNYITDLFIDSKGRFWIATLDGLNQYLGNGVFISRFAISELNRAIMSIVEDDNGNLWMGTNTGIITYSPEKNLVNIYDKSDGLQGNQFYERSAFKDKDGLLYFGGMNGFNYFSPNTIGKDTTPPNIYFSDLKIFFQSQSWNTKDAVLQKHINATDEITLHYSQNVITFDFVAVDLVNPSKNQYTYILEGFDNTWYQIGTNRSATYTNLSPGEYTFKLKTSNADRTWNKKSKDIKIIVLSPWWMKSWVRAVTVTVIMLIITLIFYVRTREIQKYNKILENKVETRTMALVQKQEELKINNKKLAETIKTKDKFFSIIAHDLKNPMNALIGLSDLLLKKWDMIDKEKKVTFIDAINKSSKHLYNLLSNLLDWSQTQTGKLTVNFESCSVESLISENLELLKEQALNKKIALKSEFNHQKDIYADYNMIDAIIRNLVSNAIKYTPKNGSIKVVSSQESDKVRISVIDSGVGMTSKTILSLFKAEENESTPGTDKEKGTGLGLVVCQEFAHINKSSLSVESEVGKGSTFSILIPAYQAEHRNPSPSYNSVVSKSEINQ